MDHVKVVAGTAYCPRHAGLMNAVLRSSSPDERPPLKCRAPSLTSWLSDILDPQITSLAAQFGVEGHEHAVISEGLSHHLGGIRAQHHWERGWHVKIEGCKPVDILIDVKEEMDIVVRVSVNEVLVTRIVPPWIEHHQKRDGKGDDVQIREEFCQRIMSLIGQSLEVNISGPAASNWVLNRMDKSNVV
jgi:hypothetical protein